MTILGEQRLKVHPPSPEPYTINADPNHLDARVIEYIDSIAARYEWRESLILPTLMMTVRYHGWVSPRLMEEIADYLGLYPSQVLAVASFYSMINLKPVGKYNVQICRTLPCALNGAEKLIKYMNMRFGINNGETTRDKKFTLTEVECLAACADGPCVQINTEYYERVDSVAKLDAILESLP